MKGASGSFWTYCDGRAHRLIQMLKTERVNYYKVKKGQRLEEIAMYFSVSPYLLAKQNGLTERPYVGQILTIPEERGNRYVVQEGDSKTLLCGSEENYARLNGTDVFFVGMKIIVPCG